MQTTAASFVSLLFDAFNPDDAEAGVFIGPKVRLKLLFFRLEGLNRVHISELQERHAIGWRCSPEADRFVEAASDTSPRRRSTPRADFLYYFTKRARELYRDKGSRGEGESSRDVMHGWSGFRQKFTPAACQR